MTLQELKKYCTDKGNEYPKLSDEIYEFYDLAEMEIEGGGSTQHECELALNEIDEIIEEYNQDKL